MLDRIKSLLGGSKPDYSSYLQPVNLDYEIAQSELSQAQINLIHTTSAGIFSIYDFIDYRREQLQSAFKRDNVYAFSLTRYNDISLNTAVSKALKLVTWGDAFDRFGLWDAVKSYINTPGNDHNLLSDEQARYFINTLNMFQYQRAFFIPRNLNSHPGAEFLKSEVTYTFNTSDLSLPLTYFVFGLEHMIPEEIQGSLPKVDRSSYITGELERIVDSNVVAAIINSYSKGRFKE